MDERIKALNKVIQKLENISKEDYLKYYNSLPMEKYYIEWSEPDRLIFPKGAWIVRNFKGKYCKDFQRKSSAEKYCNILNYSIGVKS